MRFVGIDQSYTSTGFVVTDELGTILEHTIIKVDKNENIFNRAWIISETIKMKVSTFDDVKVAIEGLAFSMTGSATRDLAGLQFLIVSKLMNELNVIPFIIAPPSLKKFATNNGKAKKEEMIEALPATAKEQFKRYKKSSGLTDITDAYFLSRMLVDIIKK